MWTIDCGANIVNFNVEHNHYYNNLVKRVFVEHMEQR